MISTRPLVSALVLASLTASCGNKGLPEYSLLDRLRIIALIADTPEVDAGGGAVTITPWISDQAGGGRTLTYVAEACVDPGVGLGADPTCDGNPTRVSLATGTYSVGAAPVYTAAVATVSVTPPSAAVIYTDYRTGQPRSAIDQFNGISYLVTYRVSAASGETVRGFKRIVVSTRTPKNANPSVGEILFDGAAEAGVTAQPSVATRVRAVVPAAATESYIRQDSSGTPSTLQEQLFVTWLITSGEMKPTYSDPNTDSVYTPGVDRPAEFKLIAVVRDDRGGVGLRVFTR